MDSDFDWFVAHYSELYEQYGKCFLLISEQRVLGKYADYKSAVRDGVLKRGYGSFIVQECNGSDLAYTNYISSMCFAGQVVSG